jgi:hypothetical protein
MFSHVNQLTKTNREKQDLINNLNKLLNSEDADRNDKAKALLAEQQAKEQNDLLARYPFNTALNNFIQFTNALGQDSVYYSLANDLIAHAKSEWPVVKDEYISIFKQTTTFITVMSNQRTQAQHDAALNDYSTAATAYKRAGNLKVAGGIMLIILATAILAAALVGILMFAGVIAVPLAAVAAPAVLASSVLTATIVPTALSLPGIFTIVSGRDQQKRGNRMNAFISAPAPVPADDAILVPSVGMKK